MNKAKPSLTIAKNKDDDRDRDSGHQGKEHDSGPKGKEHDSSPKGKDHDSGHKGHDHDSGHKGHDHDSGHMGKDHIHVLVGTKGNDILTGTDGRDAIFGNKGDDKIDGGAGNDFLFGGKGKDQLLGGDGNDFLFGGKGNDSFLDGGAGSDKVFGGKGDDFANYTLSQNVGAHDFYDGGKGFDTLQLTLTSDEYLQPSVMADIDAFERFLANNENGRGGDGETFHFQSFDLDVRNFEDLKINMAPVAGPVTIGGTGGGAGPIHVLVVGGSASSSYEAAAGQLDSTVFDVTAILDAPSINWAVELENIDVVVLGDAGAGVDYGDSALFSALVDFVNGGGGVITTGGFANILSNTSGTLTPEILDDADTISPVTTDGFLIAGASTITILDPSHPIANGLDSPDSYVVAADQSELAKAIDGGATILANTTGVPDGLPAAIAYAEVGGGRTAYLGSLYMANEGFFPNTPSLRIPGSDADKIFEQAVAWAAGDRSGGGGAATDENTPLTIDDALLLAACTDADRGDVLAIFSVSPTSALGAAISFDEHGDIVYDPTSSQALQDLSTGESRADSFIYTISDGHGGFDTATVSLTVAGITDAIV